MLHEKMYVEFFWIELVDQKRGVKNTVCSKCTCFGLDDWVLSLFVDFINTTCQEANPSICAKDRTGMLIKIDTPQHVILVVLKTVFFGKILGSVKLKFLPGSIEYLFVRWFAFQPKAPGPVVGLHIVPVNNQDILVRC
jgi:hypothetical protein